MCVESTVINHDSQLISIAACKLHLQFSDILVDQRHVNIDHCWSVLSAEGFVVFQKMVFL